VPAVADLLDSDETSTVIEAGATPVGKALVLTAVLYLNAGKDDAVLSQLTLTPIYFNLVT
jgi:hypothetical protein